MKKSRFVYKIQAMVFSGRNTVLKIKLDSELVVMMNNALSCQETESN